MGLNRRHLYRMTQKSQLKGRKHEHEHSSKRQVDLDIFLTELVEELRVVECQQIWAFQRFHFRVLRRYNREEGKSDKTEVPPRRLEEALCLLTGLQFESLFYHLYAQSILPSGPDDKKGHFDSLIFAKLLMHHNINLNKLVAGLSFMFNVESWKEKMRQEGKFNRIRKKGKKARSRSPSPK